MENAAWPPISWPRNAIDPECTGIRPAMALRVVVLPPPLEPSNATTLPSGTSSDTSDTPIKSP